MSYDELQYCAETMPSRVDESLSLFADPGFEIAQSLAAEGRLDESMAVYERIGLAQAERHFQDALVLEQRGERQGLIACLKKVVAASPEHSRAWMKLAGLLSEGGSEHAFRQVLRVSPRNIDAGIGLAQLLMKERRLREAAELLEALLPHEDIRFILAHILWQLGDFPAAELHLRACIATRNDDEQANTTLVELLNRQDRVDEAEVLCRQYVAAGGRALALHLELVRVLMRQARWSDAEAVLADLVNASPDTLSLWQLYAELLEKSERAEEARAIHEKNFEIESGNLDIQLQRADFEFRQGRVSSSASLCERTARWLASASDWGLRTLPGALESRLIFHRLEAISGQVCTGTRAFVDTTGIDAGKASAFGEVVEFFCMVSGQEHVDFLEHVAFPALAATEGFDALLRERRCSYNIYTTPVDYPALKGFLSRLVARGIPYRINVELLGLSQDLYTILSLPIIDQVKRSLAMQSVVVMALPDAIISGSVKRVIDDMKPFETVVCAMPRINSEIAYPALKAHFAGPRAQNLDSREFVWASMTTYLHAQTYSALVSDTPCLRYRDCGGYFSAHNWAPPPLCFQARPEMLDHMLRNPLCGPTSIASFYAIDHDFVDSAWRSGNLRLITDSDYFFWAEFTGPTRHAEFLAGRKAEDYYYPESARHVFAHEFKWIYSDESH